MSTTNALNITTSGIPLLDTSTGDFSYIDLTSKGDILTFDGTNYAKLAVGTDGQALMADSSQSTGLKFAAASASSIITLITTASAANSTSIDFTSFNDSAYCGYIFTMANVVPATDGDSLWARFSTDSGGTWLSANYYRVRMSLNSSSGETSIASSESSGYIELASSLGNAANEGLSGRAYFIPFTPATNKYPLVVGDFGFTNSGGYFLRNICSGANTTTSTINGIRFLMSTGNISTGIFKIYGIKNS